VRVLSFDTSGPVVAVALMENGSIVATKSVPPNESGRQEAVSQLMPTIDVLTRETNWSRNSIDLIVVGVGPGSFTGMRTSVVTARTLAQCLKIALVGIDSLKCYAASLPLPAMVILSGGRGHYFVAEYTSSVVGKDKWEPGDAPMNCVLEPCCLTRDDFVSALTKTEKCFAEDKILDEVRSLKANCEPIPAGLNIAEIQAHLAASDVDLINKNREGLETTYTYDKVNPLYLRGASITMKPTQHAEDRTGSRN
jgi:tRNA threonylcarbamoyl adenosine modification protein YeaZ